MADFYLRDYCSVPGLKEPRRRQLARSGEIVSQYMAWALASRVAILPSPVQTPGLQRCLHTRHFHASPHLPRVQWKVSCCESMAEPATLSQANGFCDVIHPRSENTFRRPTTASQGICPRCGSLTGGATLQCACAAPGRCARLATWTLLTSVVGWGTGFRVLNGEPWLWRVGCLVHVT